jgi:hypothetical protein
METTKRYVQRPNLQLADRGMSRPAMTGSRHMEKSERSNMGGGPSNGVGGSARQSRSTCPAAVAAGYAPVHPFLLQLDPPPALEPDR